LLLNREPPDPRSLIPDPDSEVWQCLVHRGRS
jgi:hypothetical protein